MIRAREEEGFNNFVILNVAIGLFILGSLMFLANHVLVQTFLNV